MKSTDLEKLEARDMLSDNVVQYMLRKIYFSLGDNDQNRVHIYDPFFYSQLMDNKMNSLNYNLIKKWTKGFDIFQKEFVFVPIEQNMHWSLLCIVGLQYLKWIEGRPATLAELLEDDKTPCILFMDSLNIHPYEEFNINILK